MMLIIEARRWKRTTLKWDHRRRLALWGLFGVRNLCMASQKIIKISINANMIVNNWSSKNQRLLMYHRSQLNKEKFIFNSQK